MYKGLQHFHSYWAYLVLIGLAISIIGAIMKSGKAYTNGDRKMALFGLIPAHCNGFWGLFYISFRLWECNLPQAIS